MRFLFNQNLSVRLVGSLSDVYPGSSHVSLVGLDRASDAEVFNYALDKMGTHSSARTSISSSWRRHAALLRKWCGSGSATAPPRRSKTR
jgi:hypothetical protein